MNDEQEFNYLNVIPLVDVMLVLLTIVLTTSTFIATGSIQVNLPKAARIREKTAATHGQAFADSLYRAYIADERYLRAAWEVLGEESPAEWLGLPAASVDAFREIVLEKSI